MLPKCFFFLACATVSITIVLISFVLSGSYMPISGFQGILAGFLVGTKQIIPDQELSLLRLKAKVWTCTMVLLHSSLAF